MLVASLHPLCMQGEEIHTRLQASCIFSLLTKLEPVATQHLGMVQIWLYKGNISHLSTTKTANISVSVNVHNAFLLIMMFYDVISCNLL